MAIASIERLIPQLQSSTLAGLIQTVQWASFCDALTKVLADVSSAQKTAGALSKAFIADDPTVSLEKVMVAGVKSSFGFQATFAGAQQSRAGLFGHHEHAILKALGTRQRLERQKGKTANVSPRQDQLYQPLGGCRAEQGTASQFLWRNRSKLELRLNAKCRSRRGMRHSEKKRCVVADRLAGSDTYLAKKGWAKLMLLLRARRPMIPLAH